MHRRTFLATIGGVAFAGTTKALASPETVEVNGM
jgi:hypothetical protein